MESNDERTVLLANSIKKCIYFILPLNAYQIYKENNNPYQPPTD